MCERFGLSFEVRDDLNIYAMLCCNVLPMLISTMHVEGSLAVTFPDVEHRAVAASFVDVGIKAHGYVLANPRIADFMRIATMLGVGTM